MIPATSIRLDRAEGTHADVQAHHVVLSGPYVWHEADQTLVRWSDSAPATGGYDKTDFTVTFADGQTYQGRFDMMHWSVEMPSLAGHVRGFLRFYAGEERPDHITPQQYQRLLDQQPELTEATRKFLQSYAIGGQS